MTNFGAAVAALGLSMLAACVSGGPRAAAPPGAVAAPHAHASALSGPDLAAPSSVPGAPGAPANPPRAQPDASYDWHGLIIEPFDTLLKDSPLPLHEVLLFHDEAQGGAAGEEPECYAADGGAPRFLGREVDEYLLCYQHDRLMRIDATVALPADRAADIFLRACSSWLETGAPGKPHVDSGRVNATGTGTAVPSTSVSSTGVPSTGVSSAAVRGTGGPGAVVPSTAATGTRAAGTGNGASDACAGIDGNIGFSAHLWAADHGDGSVSMTLVSTATSP